MGRNPASERPVRGESAPGALVLHPGARDAGPSLRAPRRCATVAPSPARRRQPPNRTAYEHFRLERQGALVSRSTLDFYDAMVVPLLTWLDGGVSSASSTWASSLRACAARGWRPARPDPGVALHRVRQGDDGRRGDALALCPDTRKMACVGVGRPVGLPAENGPIRQRWLALRGILVAIDIAPSMVDLARRQLAGSAVRFEVASFEEFEADPASFDLIVSATAFHWIDPDVAWSKTARLLRHGGWLAVLGVRETYADPVGARLVDTRIGHSGDGGAWARRREIAVADIMASSGFFAPPRVRSHVERTGMRLEVVLDVERTRATYLDYDAATRCSFTAALRDAVARLAEVPAEIHAHIVMAQRLS